jgi:hypothetical protein
MELRERIRIYREAWFHSLIFLISEGNAGTFYEFGFHWLKQHSAEKSRAASHSE